MPLLDHFHPPLFGRHHWESFHGQWAAAISDGLNQTLPADYFAEFQLTVGSRIEVDVATFGPKDPSDNFLDNGAKGPALAVQMQVWAPPVPVAVMPAIFPDDMEVRVFSSEAGPTLVAAIDQPSLAARRYSDKMPRTVTSASSLASIQPSGLATCGDPRRLSATDTSRSGLGPGAIRRNTLSMASSP